MKKAITIISCIITVLLFSSITAYAGNSFNNATALPLNTDYYCNISKGGEVQYFSFTPSKTGYYTFSADGYYDTVGAIYDNDKYVLADNDDSNGENFSCTALMVKGYRYYLSAKLYESGDTGGFFIKITGPESDTVYIDEDNISIYLDKSTYSYTGSPIKPSVTVYLDYQYKLTEGVDYSVSYSNNTAIGTARVSVTGKSPLSGTVSETFRICEADKNIEDAVITLPSYSYNYTGSAVKPTPSVKINGKVLRQNIDYYLEYYSNVNCGTATVYINGMNDYEGWTYVDYKIVKPAIKSANVALSASSVTYNYGFARTVGVKVKVGARTLVNGTDYTVKYLNNHNAGYATVVVTAKGNYSGTVKKNFRILPKKISSATIYDEIYNGKKKNPPVYITHLYYDRDYEEYYYGDKKAVKGKDYTVKYSGGHKKIGTYTATIKFKGNYTGTVKKKFKIIPKYVTGIKSKKLSKSEAKISWKKVKGASGYLVYAYDSKKGKERLVKKTKATSIKLKKLRSDDEAISFTIIAYKKVGKKTYKSYNNGGYVELGKVAPKITVSRTDFGEFYVYFNSIDNYEVFISDNKKFSSYEYGSYLRSWRYSNVNSVRYYNFDSGRKYYIKARKYYYNSKGQLKMGPWSKVKTVVPY